VSDTLSFSMLESAVIEQHPFCCLCKTRSPSFSYRFVSEEPDFQLSDGECCLPCGCNLLAALGQIQRKGSVGQPPQN
jgi:hypothetical protein